MNVLISPDKFKGTLAAQTAAEAIARGWKRARPADAIRLAPITDGGDGFGEALAAAMRVRRHSIKTMDASHRSCRSRWWWDAKTRTAIIETATVIGLAMLPPGRFHPFVLDTYGLGAVLRAAARKGARRLLIGLGGSATNDGGFGMARALGWKFFDADGTEIVKWPDLQDLARVHEPQERLRFEKVTIAVDVHNPLLGRHGATRIYGPQKGVRPRDVLPAEKALGRLAQVMNRQFGGRKHSQAGAGAGGGLGFGFLSFLDAELESGFELFSEVNGLVEQLKWADKVITGEGSLDRSTLMGKAAGQLAKECRRKKIPCVALAGVVAPEARRARLFSKAYSLTELAGPRAAKTQPAYWLERLAFQAANQ